MKIQNKLKLITLITLILISTCSVVLGRYIVATENKEITNISIKTCEFKIADFSKYGTLDLYIDGKKEFGDISSLSKRYTIGTKYEIKNIKINSGYTLNSNTNNFVGTLSNNTTINLSFSTNSYTISYDLNGGSISNETKSYTVESDTFTLPIPTKPAHAFVGWTGTGLSEPTQIVKIEKGSTENRSYTANWVVTSFSISYNLNGGSIENASNSYSIDSETFTLPKPTKIGYRFTGWTGTGLNAATETVTITKGSTGDRSYTANWELVDYTISYNLNGGSMSGQRTSYNYETENFTLPTPTRTGYTFTGWTGTGLSSATKSVTVGKGNFGDRSYTANWVDDIAPVIHNAWITKGPEYETKGTDEYGYRVNIQVSCSDSGSGVNRVLTYYEVSGNWVGETNITSTLTDSFWFKPGYRRIKIVVFDNAGNSAETIIGAQCG